MSLRYPGTSASNARVSTIRHCSTPRMITGNAAIRASQKLRMPPITEPACTCHHGVPRGGSQTVGVGREARAEERKAMEKEEKVEEKRESMEEEREARASVVLVPCI